MLTTSNIKRDLLSLFFVSSDTKKTFKNFYFLLDFHECVGYYNKCKELRNKKQDKKARLACYSVNQKNVKRFKGQNKKPLKSSIKWIKEVFYYGNM